MIKKLKDLIDRCRKYWYVKRIQYPEQDLATLIQMREWLNEQIAIRTAQHKSVKEVRRLAIYVTARIMQKQREK